MARRLLRLVCVCSVVILTSAFVLHADELGNERFRMKSIGQTVSNEIEKRYYDPNLKGLNWKGLLEETKRKIDSAKNVPEMLTAIYVMVDKLKDSHTHFIPPSMNVKLKYGFEAKAVGDDIRVYRIRPNLPAERAGLKVGDKIVSLNGHSAERYSFDDMLLYYRVLHPLPAWDLVVQTGSEQPRKVLLQAKREDKPIVLDIDRLSDFWDIVLEDQTESEEERTYHTANLDGGIGYIQVREFPANADFLDGLTEKVRDSKAVIVDLRGCPGGVVDTLKSFSGHFVSDASALYKAAERKKTEEMTTKPKKPNFSGPLIILTDSRTGSAGEAFAGFFQSEKKAVVVGDGSLGRLMTSLYYSEEFGAEKIVYYAVQISVAKVLLPNGDEIEGKGITPNVICNPTGEDMRAGRDVCLDMAVGKAREALHLPPLETTIKLEPHRN
jgi:C-terminal processing protease CtpA/Prc